jgi:hypothetical protein
MKDNDPCGYATQRSRFDRYLCGCISCYLGCRGKLKYPINSCTVRYYPDDIAKIYTARPCRGSAPWYFNRQGFLGHSLCSVYHTYLFGPNPVAKSS